VIGCCSSGYIGCGRTCCARSRWCGPRRSCAGIAQGFEPIGAGGRRGRAGRPTIGKDVRDLIREISLANPLWGAPRIHGELLKLGIEVAQSTVSKYMARGQRPPRQSWWTFLRNHADGIASADLFVVPTITFRLLYGFIVLRHQRRQIVSFGVTAVPSENWIRRTHIANAKRIA
jgi:hypothetical protein